MNVRKTILFKFTNSDLLLALVESLNLKYCGFELPYYKVRKGHIDFYRPKFKFTNRSISNRHHAIEGGGYECHFQYSNKLIIHETFATPNQYTISIVLVVF